MSKSQPKWRRFSDSNGLAPRRRASSQAHVHALVEEALGRYGYEGRARPLWPVLQLRSVSDVDEPDAINDDLSSIAANHARADGIGLECDRSDCQVPAHPSDGVQV